MKNCEPKTFTVGESLEWTRQVDDYLSATGWTLTYYFRGAGKGFNATLSADDSVFVSSATTAEMQPGNYSWQLFAAKEGANVLIDSGTAEVQSSFIALDPDATFDGRNQNKKTLDAIRAMILGKATLDQQEYAIGNRQLKRIPISDLIALESHYTQKVSREKQAERLKKGGGFFKQVHIRLKG